MEVLEILDKYNNKNKDATKLGMIYIGRKIIKSKKTLPSDYFKTDFDFPFYFHEKLKIRTVEYSVDLFQKDDRYYFT